MSTDISRSTYRPSVGRYIDRHIGRVSVEYRSICRPICRSRGAQNTHDPNIFTISNKAIMVIILFADFEQLGNLVPIKLIFS